jgi:NADH-quinone oxidoreductase subunit L
MRFMGGLRHKMKTTTIVYLIGSLALMGIFPLAGFWSKDEILAHGSANSGTTFTVVYWLLTAAAFCTAFYMGRQLKMVFFGRPRHGAAEHASESPPIITVPLIILAVLSIAGGLLNVPFFSSSAAQRAEETHNLGLNLGLEQWLEHSVLSFELSEAKEGMEALLHLPHTPTWIQPRVALISTALALLALGLAMLVVYRRRPETAEQADPLSRTPIWWFSVLPLNTLYMDILIPGLNRATHWLGHTLDGTFWHDFFHDRVIRDGYLWVTRIINDQFDTKVIDNFFVNGSGRAANWLAGVLRRTQTGYIRNYALAVILGVVALLAYFVFV